MNDAFGPQNRRSQLRRSPFRIAFFCPASLKSRHHPFVSLHNVKFNIHYTRLSDLYPYPHELQTRILLSQWVRMTDSRTVCFLFRLRIIDNGCAGVAQEEGNLLFTGGVSYAQSRLIVERLTEFGRSSQALPPACLALTPQAFSPRLRNDLPRRRFQEGCEPLQDTMPAMSQPQSGRRQQDRPKSPRSLRSSHRFSRRLLVHRRE